jgi:hypothetical protein
MFMGMAMAIKRKTSMTSDSFHFHHSYLLYDLNRTNRDYAIANPSQSNYKNLQIRYSDTFDLGRFLTESLSDPVR